MKRVIKLIDYGFQHDFQLTEAYDDSNTVDGLCDDFEMILIGRLDIKHKLEKRICEDKILKDKKFKVFFLNKQSNPDEVIGLIKTIAPDVIHFHGNHGWPQYPYYADVIRNLFGNGINMIFSPAGTSCGTETFLAKFNKVVVNHQDQVKRMKCPENKIVVRRRGIHPIFEYSRKVITENKEFCKKYDFIYVAGIIPQKRIDIFLDFASKIRNKLFIMAGDETRDQNYYYKIYNICISENLENVFINSFVSQKFFMSTLLKSYIFFWPNIKPENPETTTNRAVGEALGAGLPLLLGENAFKNTEFVINGYNGFLYSDIIDFKEKSRIIMENWNKFSENSLSLAKEKFSFNTNFIDFYKKLYNA